MKALCGAIKLILSLPMSIVDTVTPQLIPLDLCDTLYNTSVGVGGSLRVVSVGGATCLLYHCCDLYCSNSRKLYWSRNASRCPCWMPQSSLPQESSKKYNNIMRMYVCSYILLYCVLFVYLGK